MLVYKVLLFLLICVPIVLTTISLSTPREKPQKSVNYRLPNNTRPLSYILHITIDEFLIFTGTIEIYFTVDIPSTKSITLHQRDLKFLSATLEDPDEDFVEIPLLQPEYDEKKEFITFTIDSTETTLQKGMDYRLTIQYFGTLGEGDQNGFYRSAYRVAEDGTPRYVAATLFEPTYARQVFPCYDEPAMRALFTLDITHPEGYHALSNMPVEKVEPANNTQKGSFATLMSGAGWPIVLTEDFENATFLETDFQMVVDDEYENATSLESDVFASIAEGNKNVTFPKTTNDYVTTTFMETVEPMSTYLFAFVVSDFPSKNKTDEYGYVHRIFAQPDYMHTVDFGLDIAVRTLDYFEKYLGVPFPFPKIDLVAIPYRISSMENWGLITFVEEALLYEEGNSTTTEKRNIVQIIVHEYAHQWFGNLVTPKWWTYIWLNEGIATLFGYMGVDHLFPEWNIMEAFVYYVLHDVLVVDGFGNSTRAISHHVDERHQIEGLFDMINYSKAGCVVYMMMNAFNATTFKEGLIVYLKQNMYSVTDEDDLFAALEIAVKKDRTLDDRYNVSTIFSSWTRNPGYPLVSVTRHYRSENENVKASANITQARCDLYNTTYTRNNSIWWIPYNIVTAHKFAPISWMGTVNTSVGIDVSDNDWLLLNNRQTALYRIKYDERNYKLLSEALMKDHRVFDVTIRSQLIDDAFYLAHLGHIPIHIALELTKYLDQELEFIPWGAALKSMGFLDKSYCGSLRYPEFKGYFLSLVSPVYNQISLVPTPNEPHLRQDLRNDIINWACHLGYTKCLEETRNILSLYLTNQTTIHQDHTNTIICNGIRSASEFEFNMLITKIKYESDQYARQHLIASLGCTSNHTLASKMLYETLKDTDTYLLSQEERAHAFIAVATHNLNSSRIAIDFLHRNLEAALLSYGKEHVNTAVKRLAFYVVDSEIYSEFQKLLTVASDILLDYNYKVASKSVDENIEWLKTNEKIIAEWIKTNSGTAQLLQCPLVMVLLLLFLLASRRT